MSINHASLNRLFHGSAYVPAYQLYPFKKVKDKNIGGAINNVPESSKTHAATNYASCADSVAEGYPGEPDLGESRHFAI